MDNRGIRFLKRGVVKIFRAQVWRHYLYYHALANKLAETFATDETHQLKCNAGAVEHHLLNIINIIDHAAGRGRGPSMPPDPNARYTSIDPQAWRGDGI